jgi:hypothetical protein
MLPNVELLNPEQRAVAEGLSAIVERLDPIQLDVAASSVSGDADGLNVTLVHASRHELQIDVNADGHGEIVVSYGQEHEHFRSEDSAVGREWPFWSPDHIQATLTLVEGLLTGRVELHVWKRPFGIRTRSFWIDEDGAAAVFLRGGTVGPFFGWSRTPEIYHFDFTKPGAPRNG